ncbi:MAG: DUF4129 domain-containing protein [Chthonomonas sp.]|nr:DUF4129 domain-containing protein [Chthonomonas sp.]
MASVRVFGLSLLFVAAFAGAQSSGVSLEKMREDVVMGKDAKDYRAVAEKELSSGYNRDARPGKYDNDWAENAFRRLSRRDAPVSRERPPSPDVELPSSSTLTFIMWVVLAAAVVIALYFLLRNVDLAKRGKKAGADADKLMSEVEAKYSVDQWLALAAKMESEGRLREAVRALYLAALVTMDRRKLLRMRPWETNWEHYYRFAESRAMVDLPLRTITQNFDDLWYGSRVAGLSDVAEFRAFVGQVEAVPFA